MAQCHKDPDFLHNLSHLVFPLSSYTFASDLSMFYRVKSQMYSSKRPSAKALRSNNISSYMLNRLQVESGTRMRTTYLLSWLQRWGRIKDGQLIAMFFPDVNTGECFEYAVRCASNRRRIQVTTDLENWEAQAHRHPLR